MISGQKSVCIAVLLLVMSSSFLLGEVQETTVSIEFQVTEDALNSGIRTQVFPRPVGVYSGENYLVQLEIPTFSAGDNSVSFSFDITGTYTDANVPISFSYTIVEPDIEFHGSVSTLGVIATLEGISTEINSWSIPAWLKTIVIAAYEGLDLEVYPMTVIEISNDAVPDYYAIDVVDIPVITWDSDPGVVKFTLGAEFEYEEPTVICQWRRETSNSTDYQFRFMSNVRTTIKAGNVYTVLGQTGGSDTDIDVEVEPGTWSSTIT
ncbi:MAG: hypothetical protein HQ508_00525, partial [Candidatus Marinimicrobia bacterium]|nr:hypothetical protein [Candidatus Neomarinimicrobiota bacterium]